MVLQVVKDLKHRFVETLAIGHAVETVGLLGSIGLDVGVELSQRHPRISLGGSLGVLHVEVRRQRFALSDEVADLLSRLLDISRSQVFVRSVVQNAVFQ